MQMSPVIAVHMTASLIALVIGPIAMWARLGQTKRPWIHRDWLWLGLNDDRICRLCHIH